MFELSDFIYWWTHITLSKFLILLATFPLFLLIWKLLNLQLAWNAWLACAMLIFIMRIKWLYSEYFWYWITAVLAAGFQFFFVTFWPIRLVAGLMGFFFIGGSWIVDFVLLYYIFTLAGKLMNAPIEKEYIYD